MRARTRIGAVAVGVAVLAPLVGGCTDIARALNQGGDTPCRDYVGQDPDTKRMTITKAIKQQTGQSNEPAGTVVDSLIVQVDLLCAGQRNADTPIKDADIAGIFLNK